MQSARDYTHNRVRLVPRGSHAGYCDKEAGKASLRKVRFKVSNQPKVSGRRQDPRQTEEPSPCTGRSVAGSKNVNGATLLF